MAGLPVSARLHRAADFAALRHAPGRLRTRHFLLRWTDTPASTARLGLAVSRKVSRRAVTRNRIKRVIRESFRARREALPKLDVLVIARFSAADIDNALLSRDLGFAWRKLEALKRPAAASTIAG